MTWNYRVMRLRPPSGDPYLALREVHYEGETPVSYSDEDATFVADDVEAENEGRGEILAALNTAIMSVFTLPVLDVAVFDLPPDQRPKCPRSTTREPA